MVATIKENKSRDYVSGLVKRFLLIRMLVSIPLLIFSLTSNTLVVRISS